MYSDGLIGARITTIVNDKHGLYGAQRVAAPLKEDPAYTPANHKKVARIITSHGTSKALPQRRRCTTTERKPGHRVMPDLVGRKFTAQEPNRAYVGDMYLPAYDKGGKNMYLATVIDTYSRKRAGYGIYRPQVRLTGHRCEERKTLVLCGSNSLLENTSLPFQGCHCGLRWPV